MTVPLATLRRHSLLVWLHDSLGAPRAVPAPQVAPAPTVAPAKSSSFAVSPGRAPVAKLPAAPAVFEPTTQLDATQGRRLSFWSDDEAAAWLRHWKSDASALMQLRYALQRIDPSAPVFWWNDDQVIDKLAQRLARGALVATQSAQAPQLAVLPSAPATPAPPEPPAVPVSQLLAVPVPPPPLLPVLEEVQMEGAEVLPEIEQSLEQVDITIGEIKVAPVSLEPTPSKVPAIGTAMTEAGADVTATLDKL